MVTNSISAKKQELLSCHMEIDAIWQHVRGADGITTGHPRLQRLAYLQALALQLEAELRLGIQDEVEYLDQVGE